MSAAPGAGRSVDADIDDAARDSDVSRAISASSTPDPESAEALVSFIGDRLRDEDGSGEWMGFALMAYDRKVRASERERLAALGVLAVVELERERLAEAVAARVVGALREHAAEALKTSGASVGGLVEDVTDRRYATGQTAHAPSEQRESPLAIPTAATDRIGPSSPKFMRIAEYAGRVGYSERTIGNFITDGFPTVGNGRLRRVDVERADEWIRKRAAREDDERDAVERDARQAARSRGSRPSRQRA